MQLTEEQQNHGISKDLILNRHRPDGHPQLISDRSLSRNHNFSHLLLRPAPSRSEVGLRETE